MGERSAMTRVARGFCRFVTCVTPLAHRGPHARPRGTSEKFGEESNPVVSTARPLTCLLRECGKPLHPRLETIRRPSCFGLTADRWVGTLAVMLTKPSEAAQRAQEIYDEINARASQYPDFALSELEQSRQYFDLSTPELRTRQFDVLTTLVGLPIPSKLGDSLTRRLDAILDLLPDGTRVYRVRPELLHWESHIIRRPREPEPPLSLDEVAERFSAVVSDASAFSIDYRGFFISPDGTIAFQGYGPTAELRAALLRELPFSSSRQNQTAHISVARILDPIGSDAFRKLLDFRASCETDNFGELTVRQIKLVSERRWYMEEYEILREVCLN